MDNFDSYPINTSSCRLLKLEMETVLWRAGAEKRRV